MGNQYLSLVRKALVAKVAARYIACRIHLNQTWKYLISGSKCTTVASTIYDGANFWTKSWTKLYFNGAALLMGPTGAPDIMSDMIEVTGTGDKDFCRLPVQDSTTKGGATDQSTRLAKTPSKRKLHAALRTD